MHVTHLLRGSLEVQSSDCWVVFEYPYPCVLCIKPSMISPGKLPVRRHASAGVATATVLGTMEQVGREVGQQIAQRQAASCMVNEGSGGS